MIVVVMGVSGAGKSTVGRALAERLRWTFADADAYHSPESMAKMREGEGLTEADREPWLQRLSRLISSHLERGVPLVLACSALKSGYRDSLSSDDGRVQFVWLDVPAKTLEERLLKREGHVAGPSLLQSQLRDLEPPGEAIHLDGRWPIERLVSTIQNEIV